MSLSKNWRILFSDVMYNYVGMGLSIFNGIILLPFYLGFVSKEAYGIWLALGSGLAIFSMFGGGFDLVLLQRLSRAKARNNSARVRMEFSSGFYLTIILALLLVAIVLSIASVLILNLNIPSYSEQDALVIIYVQAAALFTQLLLFHFKTLPLAYFQPKKAGLAEIIGRVVSIIVIATLITNKVGIISFAIGQLLHSIVALVVVIWTTKSLLRDAFIIRVPFVYLKSQFREYYPSIFGSFGSRVFNGLQVPLVSAILGPEMAASYGVTNRIFETFRMLISPFTKSLLPIITSKIHNTSVEYDTKKVEKYHLGLISGVTIALLGLIIGSRFVINLWVGEDYYIGHLITVLLGGVVAAEFGRSLLGGFFVSHGYRFQLSWISVIELGCSILLLWSLYNLFSIHKVEIIPMVMILSSTGAMFFTIFFAKRKNLLYLVNMVRNQLIAFVLLISISLVWAI